MEHEYIKFERRRSPEAFIQRVNVVSRRSGDLLGLIKWYGAWRQYAFFPEPDTIWNADCLATVNDEIERLMAEHKTNALLDAMVDKQKPALHELLRDEAHIVRGRE